MNIFVYSDESGVFDVTHNRFFVFGGIMFLDAESRDVCARKYVKAEHDVKAHDGIPEAEEAKASRVSNESKGKLFRALNNQIRFGVIIDETRILPRIWKSKKDKQRFLDYAYKIAVKRCFEHLIACGRIQKEEVRNISFFVDEHTTATNGCYELRESLEEEFKNGMYSSGWDTFYPPNFPNTQLLRLKWCNSSTVTLVRAADIVANKIYHNALMDEEYSACDDDLFIIRLFSNISRTR